MKQTVRWSLGLILMISFTGIGQTVTAGSPKTRLTLTIHVYNYAAVDDKTLAQAEQVAIGIFRKAGVEILWISENNQSSSLNHGAFTLSYIQLDILPTPMAAVLNFPDKVMGLICSRHGTQPAQDLCLLRPSRGPYPNNWHAAKLRETISLMLFIRSLHLRSWAMRLPTNLATCC